MKKIIIIGASSGIGRELALLLAANGYNVGITGRRAQLLEQVRDMDPDRITACAFDVAGTGAVGKLAELIEKLGGMDMLVFSSGTGFENPQLDPEVERETNALNVVAFMEIMDFAYTWFAKRGSGHIAAITSVMGIRGSGAAPAYAASKAYQINYLEGLRQKAAKEKSGISVTELRPGSVDTAMMKGEGHFWISSPRRAAECIYAALGRRKRVAYVTPRWKAVGILLQWMPKKLYEKL